VSRETFSVPAKTLDGRLSSSAKAWDGDQVWEALVPHIVERAVPATPVLPLAGREEPVVPWQDMARVRGEPSVFNLIPFQPSFDTSSVTRMYAWASFSLGVLGLRGRRRSELQLRLLRAEILSPCCSFYMHVTKCSPRAWKVIALVGKAMTRPRNASTSTRRSLMEEITSTHHGKVTSLHHVN
jgi:hypothetical protein